jgi:hypothetical protein
MACHDVMSNFDDNATSMTNVNTNGADIFFNASTFEMSNAFHFGAYKVCHYRNTIY